MKRRRQGFTLIELIAAMAVLGVALSTVTLALHVLYRVDTRVRESLAWQANLDRFTVAFRRDAHEADEARLPPAKAPAKVPDQLVLRMPQSTSISYVLGARSIDRIVRQVDKVLSRESFRLPASSAQWDATTNAGVTKVTLRLLPLGPATDGLQQRREENVTAVVRMFRVPGGAKPPDTPSVAPPQTSLSPSLGGTGGVSTHVLSSHHSVNPSYKYSSLPPGGTGGLSTRVRTCPVSTRAAFVSHTLLASDICNTITEDVVRRSKTALENESCSTCSRQQYTGGQATRATQYRASKERFGKNGMHNDRVVRELCGPYQPRDIAQEKNSAGNLLIRGKSGSIC
jgi:prepilin-type N-terminal cleavage/methylation domain-containing protein